MAGMLGPAPDRNYIAAAAHARGAVEMQYTIAIGRDHAGLSLKAAPTAALAASGHATLDILRMFLSTPYEGAAMISVWPSSPLPRGIP
jgi:hypothetical protein